jgi:hypothetical protein
LASFHFGLSVVLETAEKVAGEDDYFSPDGQLMRDPSTNPFQRPLA